MIKRPVFVQPFGVKPMAVFAWVLISTSILNLNPKCSTDIPWQLDN